MVGTETITSGSSVSHEARGEDEVVEVNTFFEKSGRNTKGEEIRTFMKEMCINDGVNVGGAWNGLLGQAATCVRK